MGGSILAALSSKFTKPLIVPSFQRLTDEMPNPRPDCAHRALKPSGRDETRC